MTTYVISTPPTANNMYVNVGKSRRKSNDYVKWIRGELKALMAQRARPIIGRATISITLPKTLRGDIDNRIKPVLDLLVRAGVLTDDNSKFLASVSATFGDVELCHVSVEPESKPAMEAA